MRKSLIESLNGLWPFNKAGSSSAGPELPALERLCIDLTGSKIAPVAPGSPRSGNGQPARTVSIEEVELGADPLDVCGVDVQVGVSLRGFRIDFGPPDSEVAPSFGVRTGQVTAATTPDGVHRLLDTAFQTIGRQHGLKVVLLDSVLESPDSKSLRVQIGIKAGIGPFHAKVRVGALVSIDERLQVELSELTVRGKGIVGRVAARVTRRLLRDFDGVTVPLREVPLGAVQLQAVDVETAPAVRVTARFASPPKAAAHAGRNGPAGASHPGPPSEKALEIYVIDTGGNGVPRGVLDRYLRRFERTLSAHRLRVLTREESETVLAANPSMIGADPILLVLDTQAREEKRGAGYGFRYSLGAVKDAGRCAEILEGLLRILGDRERSGDVPGAVREAAPAWGVDAALRILGDRNGGGSGRR